MRRVPKKQAPTLPDSHLELLRAHGFEVLRYQNRSIEVRCGDGSTRHEWLPCAFVNWDKKLFVDWREDDKYAFHGWEPQIGHNFGGRYETVGRAIAWFCWLQRQTDSAA